MAAKKNRKMKTDIVIIGGGGAGLAGALTAYEKGSKALVLEKRGVVGGNALLAEGFFAAESPAQKRLLIDAKRVEPEQVSFLDFPNNRKDYPSSKNIYQKKPLFLCQFLEAFHFAPLT